VSKPYPTRPRSPELGFRRIKTTRASESLETYMYVSLTYVYRCDERLVHAIYIGPGHGLLHRYGVLTLAEVLDLYVETPATGLSEPISW
jgi:hypothetical protein